MQSIVTTTVGDQSYELLLNSIVSGEMRPGERIIEANLASKYNISRTPLRDALHRLEQDGLLVRLPKRGLAVSPVSVKEAKSLGIVRCYIEGLAARLTTENLTNDQIEYLKQLRDSVDYNVIVRDQDALKEFGRTVHAFIWENCDNSFCRNYLEKLRPIVSRYKNISVARPGRRIQSFREHLKIIDCMINRNADQAEMEMRKHTEVSLNGSIETIKGWDH